MLHVVVGPPCAGKSTYVAENAEPDELRIDFDAIAQTLGSSVAHAATGNVKDAAFAARAALIDHALAHPDATAWIIHTAPTAAQLDAYKAADAAVHVVDPGVDVCLRRAEDDDRPDHTAGAIASWYDDPPVVAVSTPKRRALEVDLLSVNLN